MWYTKSDITEGNIEHGLYYHESNDLDELVQSDNTDTSDEDSFKLDDSGKSDDLDLNKM